MRITSQDIATEAAVKILNTLVFDWKIPVNYIFDFFNNSDRYKSLLDDDDVLIISLHDNSIDEIIQTIGEQINDKYDISWNSI